MFARVELGLNRRSTMVVWSVILPNQGGMDKIVAAGSTTSIKGALDEASADVQRLKLVLKETVAFITTGKYRTEVFPATPSGTAETSLAILGWYEVAVTPRKLRRTRQRSK